MKSKKPPRSDKKVNLKEILGLIYFYKKRHWDVSSALEFLVRYRRGTL